MFLRVSRSFVISSHSPFSPARCLLYARYSLAPGLCGAHCSPHCAGVHWSRSTCCDNDRVAVARIVRDADVAPARHWHRCSARRRPMPCPWVKLSLSRDGWSAEYFDSCRLDAIWRAVLFASAYRVYPSSRSLRQIECGFYFILWFFFVIFFFFFFWNELLENDNRQFCKCLNDV